MHAVRSVLLPQMGKEIVEEGQGGLAPHGIVEVGLRALQLVVKRELRDQKHLIAHVD